MVDLDEIQPALVGIMDWLMVGVGVAIVVIVVGGVVNGFDTRQIFLFHQERFFSPSSNFQTMVLAM